MKDIQIGLVRATLFEPKEMSGKRPAALLIHGWQSGQDRMFDLAELLSEKLGMVCLTFDLRGHGKSGGTLGELSRKDFLDDALAAYDYLAAQENVDQARIGVSGSSFGGYLAPLISAQRPVEWMALRVPADYLDDDFEIVKVPGVDNPFVQEWRKELKPWDATAALRAVHAFQGPLLVVESELDDIVPKETVQSYADAVSDKKNLRYEIMKGAPHSLTKFPEFKKQFNNLVCSWLQALYS